MVLASGSDDHTIKLWRVTDGQLLETLTGSSEAVLSVAFSPDGRLLASGSSDGTIRLWSMRQ
jgi:WD40 repeat protein